MAKSKIDQLRAELHIANKLFDAGEMTAEDLKTIIYKISKDLKSISENEIEANGKLLENLIPAI